MPGRDRERQGPWARGDRSVSQVAEDAPVEVNKAKQAGRDPASEDQRHGRKRRAVAVREGGLDGSAGVAEDVPEEKDQDSGREGVEKTLDSFRKAAQPRHRQAQENRAAGDRPQ